MTMIDKKYSSENDPDVPKDRIIDALRAGNKLNAGIATEMANLNKNFRSHKRAIGESHDKVEKEIVDQTTRLMHHINEEAKRQFKEALTEYFEKTGGMHDLLKEMITVVQNRFDYGLTIEEIEDK